MREPRVHLSYGLDLADAIEDREIPFVVGVLSDLSGTTSQSLPRFIDRQFIDIDWDNFDDVLARLEPRLEFEVKDLIVGGDTTLAVQLRFSHIHDFEPTQVIRQLKELGTLLNTLEQLIDSGTNVDENARKVSDIDDLLSRQLNLIMHTPEFQKLEASWRGLHYLVSQTETGEALKIRVLNVSKADLIKDLEKASEWDQSAFFKKVYEERYGTFGAEPFGAFIGDYEFGHHPQDIALLEKISLVAAAAHAPFIAAASPQFFNSDSFSELAFPRDLAKIFRSPEYTRWRSFRESEDSRFVGLTVPRILLRLPYSQRPTPESTFQFTEVVDPSGHSLLWGNSAYTFGACLTNAFAKYHWCARIHGFEGGGLVKGLPTWTFETDEGEVAPKCPVEIAFTDRREKELADLGFITLVHAKMADFAAFFSIPSCRSPKQYDSDSATANSRLASQLQYVLTTSRFVHYIKAISRDKIGGLSTRADYERFLNLWISRYVNVDDEASPMVNAKFPLREARIDVSEVPEKPGHYRALLFLRPHFQLDELSISLRLVAELPSPVRP
jgi:type VI secretion system protein ImpC